MGELGPHALALTLSGVGIALGLLALTRSVPARLREETETALRASRDAVDRCDRLSATWEAAKVEYGTILESMELERENLQRHRSRLSAAASRERNNEPPEPQSREDLLAQLRVESGMAGGGG
jgi:hypothetical protein